nr:NB-ARC domain-containing protein [Argonema galeatum]
MIELILNRLSDPQELSILSLSGSAGYGKTEAASVVAKEALQRNLFADVLWVTARQTELVDGCISQENQFDALNWHHFLNQIAHQLACPIERVNQHLREQKYLIVLDNAETSQVENILANLVKMLNPSRALLTSRLKTKPPYVGLIQIQGLEEEWSYKLLRDEAEYNNISALSEASNEQLYRVYKLSCGAPLALHFIVGRILDDRALDPVLSALEQASGEVEEFYKFSLEIAWQRISNIAKNVLGYMGRSDASVTLLELFDAGKVQECEWNKAKRELKRWYLIEDVQDAKGNQRYDLHPWIRSSLRGELVNTWQPSLQDFEQIAKSKFDIDI